MSGIGSSRGVSGDTGTAGDAVGSGGQKKKPRLKAPVSDVQPADPNSLLVVGNDGISHAVAFLAAKDLCQSEMTCKTLRAFAGPMLDRLVEEMNEECDHQSEGEGSRTKLLRYHAAKELTEQVRGGMSDHVAENLEREENFRPCKCKGCDSFPLNPRTSVFESQSKQRLMDKIDEEKERMRASARADKTVDPADVFKMLEDIEKGVESMAQGTRNHSPWLNDDDDAIDQYEIFFSCFQAGECMFQGFVEMKVSDMDELDGYVTPSNRTEAKWAELRRILPILVDGDDDISTFEDLFEDLASPELSIIAVAIKKATSNAHLVGAGQDFSYSTTISRGAGEGVATAHPEKRVACDVHKQKRPGDRVMTHTSVGLSIVQQEGAQRNQFGFTLRLWDAEKDPLF